MTFDASTFAGPVVTGWPAGAGPLALLGDPPAWLFHPTRRRQPDGSWTFAAVVPAERRHEASAALDVLVRARWLVVLRPAAPGFLGVFLDPCAEAGGTT